MTDRLDPIATRDIAALVTFTQRNRALLSPHMTLPDSVSGWSHCIDRSADSQWYRLRLDGKLVAIGVLARITGSPWMSAEIGVGVDGDFRCRGIGTHMLRTMFGRMLGVRLHRIEALVDPANLASTRMVAAAGMRNEGISRSVLEIGGSRMDLNRWAVTSAGDPELCGQRLDSDG